MRGQSYDKRLLPVLRRADPYRRPRLSFPLRPSEPRPAVAPAEGAARAGRGSAVHEGAIVMPVLSGGRSKRRMDWGLLVGTFIVLAGSLIVFTLVVFAVVLWLT
jgi:hypothetical protein